MRWRSEPRVLFPVLDAITIVPRGDVFTLQKHEANVLSDVHGENLSLNLLGVGRLTPSPHEPNPP